MSNNRTVSINGLPILGTLGLIFIALKLTGVITWSWLWVLAPFWIPAMLFVMFFSALVIWAIINKDKF